MCKASFWTIVFVAVFCGTMAQAAVINIDMGYWGVNGVEAGWNHVTNGQAGTLGYLRENLVDSTNAATPVDLRMEDAFLSYRSSSAGTSGSSAFSPADPVATKYNMYVYEGDADHSAAIRIEGLIVGQTYKFGFFDSYMSDNDARRECKYIIGNQSVNLRPNYNVNNVAYLDGISPDNNGTVLVTLGFGAAPTVADKVCGLAVMTIEGNFVPEPASLVMLGLGCVGLLKRRVR